MTEQQAYALKIISAEQPAHNKVLQTPAQLVLFPLNEEDKALIAAMKEKLYELKGVGLAAPQVNHHKQIIAIYIPEESALLRNNAKAYPMHMLINPSYLGIDSAGVDSDFEACYSVSNKAGKVPRFNQISVQFYDEQGQHYNRIETGFYARVLQHEIDHINGTLIIDRLTPECVQGSMEEMTNLRRQELSSIQRELFDRLMKEKQVKSKQ
ncbi:MULTISPECIES: peptide deformylase [Legionella]|uniref:Peptide deformylase n=1 Tax=Legionella drozanskii LLAP-1 TaxID=1212489 RepID=A0A0W0SX39_9GAMM|nr:MULTISPECIES: peptide deformylase [Legionella]KTC87918.1 polypeptide deformylase [Legionella drozanskii LLAP-1]PJE08791.1 MAG: peptide deformylase [Legionella sp.]